MAKFDVSDRQYSKYSLFNLMTPRPVTIRGDTTAIDAYRIMQKRRVHHLPVTEKHPTGEGERVVGMIAKGDLQRAISAFVGTKIETERDRQTLNLHVKLFMTKKVHTLPPEAGIRECADLLLSKSFNSVPVVDTETGKLMGIVTSTDLLRYLHDVLGKGGK